MQWTRQISSLFGQLPTRTTHVKCHQVLTILLTSHRRLSRDMEVVLPWSLPMISTVKG